MNQIKRSFQHELLQLSRHCDFEKIDLVQRLFTVMIPVETLRIETEARFRDRQRQREEFEQKISEQGILAANDPQLVVERMTRLQASPEQIEQLVKDEHKLSRARPEVATRSPRALERMLGTNDLIGFRFLEQGCQVGRSVARVHIRDAQGRSGYGTGFLVSPRLFLTNHHVIESTACASNSKAEFNFQRGVGDSMQPSQVFEFDPAKFFLTDQQLDFTLVALKEPPHSPIYGWLQLIASTGKLMVGEKVNIIQHPNGEHKQLAMRDNQVIDELELFLHYKSDTAPGSSGAPVFNDQWELVALHHSGVPDIDPETGKQRAIGGGFWDPSLGEHRAAWIANEGVRVSRLVAHLEKPRTQELLSSLQQEMVEEMLDATPPPNPTAENLAMDQPKQPQPVQKPQAPLTSPSSGNVATWTIPLQVSVNFGAAMLQLPSAPPPPAAVEPPPSDAQEFFFRTSRPPKSLPVPTFSLDALRQQEFSWPSALSLAMASQLAYKKDAEVRATAIDTWGFNQCEPITEGAAQCFVASSDDLVLVSFRGTESVPDWLSNLNVIGMESPLFGTVHSGFYQQFTALQPRIENLLRSRPNRPLLITGHSLGGAIAILAAATWVDQHPLLGLHTYGQPMAGKATFIRYVRSRFLDRYFRFVNDSDVVPRVPPGYRHTGLLYQFDARGGLKSRPPQIISRESALAAVEADTDQEPALTTEEFNLLQNQLRLHQDTVQAQEGVFTMFSDHSLDKYIEKIQQQML